MTESVETIQLVEPIPYWNRQSLRLSKYEASEAARAAIITENTTLEEIKELSDKIRETYYNIELYPYQDEKLNYREDGSLDLENPTITVDDVLKTTVPKEGVDPDYIYVALYNTEKKTIWLMTLEEFLRVSGEAPEVIKKAVEVSDVEDITKQLLNSIGLKYDRSTYEGYVENYVEGETNFMSNGVEVLRELKKEMKKAQSPEKDSTELLSDEDSTKEDFDIVPIEYISSVGVVEYKDYVEGVEHYNFITQVIRRFEYEFEAKEGENNIYTLPEPWCGTDVLYYRNNDERDFIDNKLQSKPKYGYGLKHTANFKAKIATIYDQEYRRKKYDEYVESGRGIDDTDIATVIEVDEDDIISSSDIYQEKNFGTAEFVKLNTTEGYEIILYLDEFQELLNTTLVLMPSGFSEEEYLSFLAEQINISVIEGRLAVVYYTGVDKELLIEVLDGMEVYYNKYPIDDTKKRLRVLSSNHIPYAVAHVDALYTETPKVTCKDFIKNGYRWVKVITKDNNSLLLNITELNSIENNEYLQKLLQRDEIDYETARRIEKRIMYNFEPIRGRIPMEIKEEMVIEPKEPEPSVMKKPVLEVTRPEIPITEETEYNEDDIDITVTSTLNDPIPEPKIQRPDRKLTVELIYENMIENVRDQLKRGEPAPGADRIVRDSIEPNIVIRNLDGTLTTVDYCGDYETVYVLDYKGMVHRLSVEEAILWFNTIKIINNKYESIKVIPRKIYEIDPKEVEDLRELNSRIHVVDRAKAMLRQFIDRQINPAFRNTEANFEAGKDMYRPTAPYTNITSSNLHTDMYQEYVRSQEAQGNNVRNKKNFYEKMARAKEEASREEPKTQTEAPTNQPSKSSVKKKIDNLLSKVPEEIRDVMLEIAQRAAQNNGILPKSSRHVTSSPHWPICNTIIQLLMGENGTTQTQRPQQQYTQQQPTQQSTQQQTFTTQQRPQYTQPNTMANRLYTTQQGHPSTLYGQTPTQQPMMHTQQPQQQYTQQQYPHQQYQQQHPQQQYGHQQYPQQQYGHPGYVQQPYQPPRVHNGMRGQQVPHHQYYQQPTQPYHQTQQPMMYTQQPQQQYTQQQYPHQQYQQQHPQTQPMMHTQQTQYQEHYPHTASQMPQTPQVAVQMVQSARPATGYNGGPLD